MSIDEIRQGSRMKRMKNGTDVEGTDMKFVGPGFSSMSPESKRKARRNGPRKKRVRERGSTRQTEDGV